MIYLLYGPEEYARSEALAELKAAIPPDLADLKARVRQARYEARLEREGGATANPATVQVKSSVNKPGGSR